MARNDESNLNAEERLIAMGLATEDPETAKWAAERANEAEKAGQEKDKDKK